MAETYEKAAGMIRACLLMALLAPLSGRAFAAEADRGREVYQKWCTPCHGTGLGKPGTSAAAAHGVKPAVLEQRTDLTPKMIETAVRKGVYFMPRFRKTEISNADLAAIIAWLAPR
jgi:(+)-pinoresinol hydroxylase